jgi:hypothetical protein
VEGIASDALGGLPSYEFDRLNNTINNLSKGKETMEVNSQTCVVAIRATNFVLDPRVFAFGVLANKDGVHAIVKSFVPFNGYAGSDVREQFKRPSQGEVEGDVTFAN